MNVVTDIAFLTFAFLTPALHERRSGEESAKADDVGEANAAPAAVDTDDVEAAVFEEVSTTVRRTSGDV